MIHVDDFNLLSIDHLLKSDNCETSGIMLYLLKIVGCDWHEYPIVSQRDVMLRILQTKFIAEEGDTIVWGAHGVVFEFIDNKWVSYLD